MTISTSDFQTLVAAQKKIASQNSNGKIRVLVDEVTLTADVIASGDVVNCLKLPKNAKVIDAIVKGPSLGTTGIFKLGHAASEDGTIDANDDAFVASVDLGGAAATVRSGLTAAASAAETGIFANFAERVGLTLTFSEATTAADTLIVQFAVTYSVE